VFREEITEAALQASLDTHAVIASIQREQAQIQAATDSLSARRDRLVNLTAAAAAATILSLIAMPLQRGGRPHVEIAPNMPAQVFDRPSAAVSV